jgi:hypothetical protein
MIPVIVKELRWRFVLLLAVAGILYVYEPAFHQHEGRDPGAVALGPLGISSTTAHLASMAMIILLGGFISADRRAGHTRLFFAQPLAPITYYGTRWLVAYIISLGSAVLFLVLGQLIAWGQFEGGFSGLILPAVTALIYGGLIAFFSVVLNKGDTWTVFLLFLPTLIPEILSLGLSRVHVVLRQVLLLLMPPNGALQRLWEGMLLGTFSPGALIYATIYGLAFLGAAALILRQREWP